MHEKWPAEELVVDFRRGGVSGRSMLEWAGVSVSSLLDEVPSDDVEELCLELQVLYMKFKDDQHRQKDKSQTKHNVKYLYL